MAGFGALRVDQLEALLMLDAILTPESKRVATYRVLAELREHGYAETVGLASRDAPTRGVVLSSTGRRVYAASDGLYPRRRVRRATSVVMLDHAVALADVAIAFARSALAAGVDVLWESDWEAVTRLGSTVVIPDALVTLDHAGWRTRAFIEADRATERRQAFARKVRRYVDLYLRDDWRKALGAWPLILTVTTSDARARSLAELAHETAQREGGGRIAHAFRAIAAEELRVRGPLGARWHVGGSAARVLLEGIRSVPSEPPEREKQCAPFQTNPAGTRDSS